MKPTRWYNITEWVDEETGELLKKEQIKNKEFRIIKSEEKTEKKTYGELEYNVRTYTRICRRHEQTRIEF